MNRLSSAIVRALNAWIMRHHRPVPVEDGPVTVCRCCKEPWPCRENQAAFERWRSA